MNTKVLSSLSAVLIVSSFVSPAMAEPLGDHPAVVVARSWNNQAIDTNTFIVAPPASTKWVAEAPQTGNEPAHTSESTQLHWSAAIGTGYTARTPETSPDMTSSEKIHSVPAPHWSAAIGTGTAATIGSATPDTNTTRPSGALSTVAAAHWTSKIGSGHPFDSASSVKPTALANAR